MEVIDQIVSKKLRELNKKIKNETIDIIDVNELLDYIELKKSLQYQSGKQLDLMTLVNYIEKLKALEGKNYKSHEIKRYIQRLCDGEVNIVLEQEEIVKDESLEDLIRITPCVLASTTGENKAEARKLLLDICRQRKQEVEDQVYQEDMAYIDLYDKMEMKIIQSIQDEEKAIQDKRQAIYERSKQLEQESKRVINVLEKGRTYMKKLKISD